MFFLHCNSIQSIVKPNRIFRKVILLGIIISLVIGSLELVACDSGVRLTIENRTITNLTIVHEGVNKDGTFLTPITLGTVYAEQTTKLPVILVLRQDIIGWKIILKAQDSSNSIVWNKSWSFEDFLKLKEVGWKIVVSPETSD